MKSPVKIPASISTAVRLALLVGALGSLGACVSIPQRAWRNGEAMSQSRAYQRVQAGDMSFKTHRELESSLNPMRLGYREVAFPAFGQWW